MTTLPPSDDRPPRKRRRRDEPSACETGTPHFHLIQDARGVRQVDCEMRELTPDDPRRAALSRRVFQVLLGHES